MSSSAQPGDRHSASRDSARAITRCDCTRSCRIEDVWLVHAYAHVGMIIRDRSPARGIRPSADVLGPYCTLKRCCLLNHTIPKLPISVKTARVAVHHVRLGMALARGYRVSADCAWVMSRGSSDGPQRDWRTAGRWSAVPPLTTHWL
jgi:hypothetical protein